MNNARSFFWIALAALGFLLWNAWQNDYQRTQPLAPTAATGAVELPAADTGSDLPAAAGAPVVPSAAAVASIANTPEPAAGSELVHVVSDVLELDIDTRGGTLTKANLRRYPVKAGEASPTVQLFAGAGDQFFVAQSGLVSSASPAPDHRALYTAARSEYRLGEGEERVEIPLTWSQDGVTVTKTYTLKRGDYSIGVATRVDNASASEWSASAYTQLTRTSPIVNRKFSFTNPDQYSFVGAAWFSPEEKFEKLAFEDFAEEPLSRTIAGGWAAQQQHYFFAAWIPDANEAQAYSTAVIKDQGDPRYLIRQLGPAFKVAPGANATTTASLYVGPKEQEKLDAIAPGLGLTIDYGMVTIFAKPVFWLLNTLHKLVQNWGFAIILTTLLVKLLLYPLSEAQYRSMAKMRKVQPRIEALKQRYGEDKQKFNQAMMELYGKEKINPVGGCLPLLLQFPIFIALYWVLLESVELRHAPFIGWLTNLSARDPYFVLPVLNAAIMWITQKMSPAPAGMDPVQQKVLQYMPLVFSITMAFFPAGLVLYWSVNGALGLAQQWVITRRIEAGEKKAA
ncbi:MAG: membrane protein insertase YidC [Xanthomonadales bacterium]|nr:membrane protein insertase YidC [Xanthomonadales bacterium]MCC6560061.1 membrane protein insertase YidC [Xanthomonadales bacterium]